MLQGNVAYGVPPRVNLPTYDLARIYAVDTYAKGQPGRRRDCVASILNQTAMGKTYSGRFDQKQSGAPPLNPSPSGSPLLESTGKWVRYVSTHLGIRG